MVAATTQPRSTRSAQQFRELVSQDRLITVEISESAHHLEFGFGADLGNPQVNPLQLNAGFAILKTADLGCWRDQGLRSLRRQRVQPTALSQVPFSAPSPVFARTMNSLNFAAQLGSWLSSVPAIAARKPSGTLRMPTFSSGNQAFA
jgi:hypothetical protein